MYGCDLHATKEFEEFMRDRRTDIDEFIEEQCLNNYILSYLLFCISGVTKDALWTDIISL